MVDSKSKTDIRLYQGVNFDNKSSQELNFTPDSLSAFLDSKPHFDMNNTSYQRYEEVIRWDAKTADFNQLLKCDYLRITQYYPETGSQDVWFGYVDQVAYLNDGTISIRWSADIWQTFRDKVTFKKGTVARGFVKEVDEQNLLTEDFKKILNTPEQLPSDGGVMEVAAEPVWFLQDTAGNIVADDRLIFYNFATQIGQVENGSFGSNTGLYQQYKYFYVPYDSRTGTTYTVYCNGKQLYKPDQTYIQDIMNELAKDSDFVGTKSQVVGAQWQHYFGLNIDKVDLTNHILYLSWDTTKLDVDIQADGGNKFRIYKIRDLAGEGVGKQYATAFPTLNAQLGLNKTAPLMETVRQVIIDYLGIDENAYHFPYKLITNEFTRFNLSNGRGATKDYDVGTYAGVDQQPAQVARYGVVDNNAKEYYTLEYWRVDEAHPTMTNLLMLQKFEQSFLIDDAPRDVTVTLDYATMYDQANKIQNATARQNAAMNVNLSNRQLDQGLQNQINMNNAGMENLQGNASYAQMKNGIAAVGSTLQGFATGGILGGLAGIGSGVAGAIGTNLNYQHQIANQQNLNDTSVGNTEANNYLSKLGNQLNYENMVRTQQAGYAQSRVDTDMVAHQGTSSNFDFVNHNSSMVSKLFMPVKSLLYFAYMHLLQFGYSINQFDDIEKYFHVKKKMNYVQAKNITVVGDVPAWVIQYFKNTLEAGVQVWEPEYIQDFYNGDIAHNDFL